jgi:hypothetical protein
LRRTHAARPCRFNHQSVDRVLADAGLSNAAADRHARGIAARADREFPVRPVHRKNNVGILQRAQRLDGQ